MCGFCRSYHVFEYYDSRQRVFSVTHSSSRSSFLSPFHGSLIPPFWQQRACPVSQASLNITAQLLSWGARLFASGWCLQGQQTCPSVQPVLRTRPLLPVAFFISPCRWTAFLVSRFPPLPASLLVWNAIWLCLPAPLVGALVSKPLTFQAGNGFSFLRGCYAALTAWLGVGRGTGEGCRSFWIASWLSGIVRCWRSSWTLQFTNSVYWSFRGVPLASD